MTIVVNVACGQSLSVGQLAPVPTTKSVSSAKGAMLMIVLSTLCLFDARISAQWIIVEANSSQQLLSQLHEQRLQHRRPVSIDPVARQAGDDDDVGFLVIYKPHRVGGSWMMRLNLTSDHLYSEQTIQNSRGYIITSLCGYQFRGTVRFVAVWEKMPGVSTQEIVFGLTSDEYLLKLREFTDKKLFPYYVCGYEIEGKDLYAGIWHKPIGYLVHWYMTHNDFDACFDADRKYARENYHALVFQPFNANAKPLCTAIWVKDYGNSYRIQTGENVQKMVAELRENDLEPQQACSFKKDGKKKYLILWTGQAFGWSGRRISVSQLLPAVPSMNLEYIDAVVVGFMRAHEIPAMSFAVSVQERLILARSYGFSDIRKREAAVPDSRFRIASVTKPFTAAAIFKLLETKQLKSLDEKVFGEGNGILGSKFGTKPLNPQLLLVTVRHLLTHTSGGWNNQLKVEFQQPSMERDEFLSWVLDAYPLQYLPGTVHVYSNMGYMFLGRVIEALSNQSYEAFVKEHLLIPSGIVGAEIGKRNRELKLPNEVCFQLWVEIDFFVFFPVTYYSDDNANPYFNWDPTRMDSAAGWVMTPIDLLRFMVRMDQMSLKTDLLSATSLAEMTTPTHARINYANGWQIKEWRSYFHQGSLAGSEALLTQLGDGTAYAACVNKRGAKENQFTAIVNEIMLLLVRNVQQWPKTDLFDTLV